MKKFVCTPPCHLGKFLLYLYNRLATEGSVKKSRLVAMSTCDEIIDRARVVKLSEALNWSLMS